jgi:hypothetical protein
MPSSYGNSSASAPETPHFYEHIMQGDVLINDPSLITLFSTLNYDAYRFIDAERTIPVYNVKGDKLYDLVLISATELKVEFQKPVSPLNIAANADKRIVKLLLNEENKLSIIAN